MPDEKMTPAQWVEHLAREQSPMTLTEFMAGCLTRLVGMQIEATQAAQHTEGMVGAMDQFARELAVRMGIPYPEDGEVREALDRRRDEQRRLAAEQRQQAIEEGRA